MPVSVVGAVMAALRNHWQIYPVRFLLGIAEGGASVRGW